MNSPRPTALRDFKNLVDSEVALHRGGWPQAVGLVRRPDEMTLEMGAKLSGAADLWIVKGEADGEATRIYAQAFSKDKDFYAFYRRMEAYKQAKKEKYKFLTYGDAMLIV